MLNEKKNTDTAVVVEVVAVTAETAETVEVAGPEDVLASEWKTIAEEDNFTEEWISRDENGDLESPVLFTVKVAPAPMFGQNIRDFGFAEAIAMAEEDECKDHSFGPCYIKKRSLRQEKDGRWYCDLAVPPRNCRYHKVVTMIVDKDDNPVLDADGEKQIRIAPRKEAWITCELAQLEPLKKGGVYRQTDPFTKGRIQAVKDSVKVGSKAKAKAKSKGRSKKISRTEYAAALAEAKA